jgi:TRAP-type uncharacterized transport system substrate-binding protein
MMSSTLGKVTFWLFIPTFLFTACQDKKDFTILSDLELGESKNNHPTVLSLQQTVKPLGVTLTFKDAPIEREADIIKLIHDEKIDIGIVKNDVDLHGGFSNVRTLMPLFPDVLLILCRSDSGSSIQNLFTKNKAAMILDKKEERNVIDLFLKKNGTTTENMGEIHAADSAALTDALNEYDVLVLFASLNSNSVRNILRNWNGSIYSLDDPKLMRQGSIVDGFCMAYPKALPFIIPKGTYGRWPLQPVLTFAVYDVLVCNKNLDEHLVYDLLKNIYDMQSTLAEDNFEFGLLDADVESHKFSFPLHEGAIKYALRDKPTFWERESEVLGLIITLIVLASGGLTTLLKHWKQRRKDRVDTYYQKVIYVNTRARQTKDIEQKENFLTELLLIRTNAFEQLIAESLDANEAFTIFGNLVNSSIQELEQDIKNQKTILSQQGRLV